MKVFVKQLHSPRTPRAGFQSCHSGHIISGSSRPRSRQLGPSSTSIWSLHVRFLVAKMSFDLTPMLKHEGQVHWVQGSQPSHGPKLHSRSISSSADAGGASPSHISCGKSMIDPVTETLTHSLCRNWEPSPHVELHRPLTQTPSLPTDPHSDQS